MQLREDRPDPRPHDEAPTREDQDRETPADLDGGEGEEGTLQASVEEPTEEEADEVVEEGQGEVRLRRRLVAATLTAALGLTAGLWIDFIVHDSFMATKPGPVKVAGDHVEITDPQITGGESGGDIFILTISAAPVGAFEALQILIFDGEGQLAPRTNLRPPGVTDTELQRQARESMRESQVSAVVAAYQHEGREITYQGDGARIIAVADDSAARRAGIEIGETITAVDGIPVQLSTDLQDLVAVRKVGDEISLTVQNQDETREVQATLGEWVAINPDTGEIIREPNRAMLGVVVETSGLDVKTDGEIDFNLSGVGGPSAGLAWALEIIDQLRGGELTKGHQIAVTGEITTLGEVRAVGGMREKTWAAVRRGAELLIVPEHNYEEAREAAISAGSEINVIGVSDLDDTVKIIEAWIRIQEQDAPHTG